jgi:phosphomannomutase/phosphoglucomutase
MGIFRAYDIRGIYGKDLTDEVAFKIGKALGTFLKGREKVCMGFDTRASSPILFEKLASGLVSTGCEVINLGMVPNPIVYFFAWKNKIFGCIITSSHNPKEWNGFKLIKPDGTSFLEEIKEIERIFDSEVFLKGNGKIVDYRNAIKDYEDFLTKRIGRVKGKIVAEFFGGAGTVASSVFKNFGLEVIGLHEKPDENFYGFERPEPKGENLKLLKETVKKEKALFGVAFDGDADRSIFVDDKGRELNGSIVSGVFIKDILKRKKGKIILTADCANGLKKITERLGGKLIWWRVGHGFIEKKCVEEKALFAGEQSSHFYFNEFYPFSDGILATLLLSKILYKSKKRLSKLVDEMKLNPVEKLYIDAKTDEKKLKIIEKIKREFPKALDLMDGIRIQLNETEWVLIRASQTLPEINLCVEAKNQKRLKKIIDEYSSIIKEKIRELNG